MFIKKLLLVIFLLTGVASTNMAQTKNDYAENWKKVEAFEKKLSVRMRVDGVLREIVQPRRELAPLLVSRIKVMAKMDIAEKRDVADIAHAHFLHEPVFLLHLQDQIIAAHPIALRVEVKRPLFIARRDQPARWRGRR